MIDRARYIYWLGGKEGLKFLAPSHMAERIRVKIALNVVKDSKLVQMKLIT